MLTDFVDAVIREMCKARPNVELDISRSEKRRSLTKVFVKATDEIAAIKKKYGMGRASDAVYDADISVSHHELLVYSVQLSFAV